VFVQVVHAKQYERVPMNGVIFKVQAFQFKKVLNLKERFKASEVWLWRQEA
jgi:hypothetical protein